MTWFSRSWGLIDVVTEVFQCFEDSVELTLIPMLIESVTGRHEPAVADSPKDIFIRHKSLLGRVANRLGRHPVPWFSCWAVAVALVALVAAA